MRCKLSHINELLTGSKYFQHLFVALFYSLPVIITFPGFILSWATILQTFLKQISFKSITINRWLYFFEPCRNNAVKNLRPHAMQEMREIILIARIKKKYLLIYLFLPEIK